MEPNLILVLSLLINFRFSICILLVQIFLSVGRDACLARQTLLVTKLFSSLKLPNAIDDCGNVYLKIHCIKRSNVAAFSNLAKQLRLQINIHQTREIRFQFREVFERKGQFDKSNPVCMK